MCVAYTNAVSCCSGKPAVIANMSARVGSIGDNSLGGWYSYRASKSALNQLTKTMSLECARRKLNVSCILLHPGTVDTDLSLPFQKVRITTCSVRWLMTCAHVMYITCARYDIIADARACVYVYDTFCRFVQSVTLNVALKACMFAALRVLCTQCHLAI